MYTIRDFLFNGLFGLIAFGVIIFGMTTCNDTRLLDSQSQDDSQSGTGNGKINFYLTDAPGDYDEVNVDIRALRIHHTPFNNDADETESDDGQWLDLPFDPIQINLLELTDIVTLLTSAELEPGRYTELRLILGSDNNIVIDDSTMPLKVPSGQESGYKIKLQADLESGEELDVTIDFDAEKSVVKAGKSGLYLLKPVLKAFVGDENSEGDETGTE